MYKKLSSFTTILFTAMLLLNLPQAILVSASPTTTVYVDPPIIHFTPDNGTVGKLFNVSVWVEDVTDLCAYAVQIRYNSTVLNCTKAYEPKTDPNYVLYGTTTLPISKWEVGKYTMSAAPFPGTEPAHFNGTGLITIFTFNITQAPGTGETLSSILNINNDQTYLLDSYGMEISPLIIEDGYYEFKGEEIPPPPPGGARISVDPPEIIDPTMRPSMTFFINITIDDVQNMRTCEFNLSYSTEILTWVGINVYRVQGEMPRPSVDADDEAGYIWMKLVYTIDVTTTDPIPIVKIEFHLDAMGATPLDLHDTELLDNYERPIDHQAEDGFFMTQIRDVAIINVIPSQNWTYPNRIHNITVIAGNLGNVNETSNVKVYYDTNLIDTRSVNLTAYSEITLVFTWNTSQTEPCHNYTIWAEIDPVPYDNNLTNNNFTDGFLKVYYLGDINRDGVVNMQDIYTIILAFLTEPGDPLWNPDADMNLDNIINMIDIYRAVMSFLKTCP